jgi:hypothetical protein
VTLLCFNRNAQSLINTSLIQEAGDAMTPVTLFRTFLPRKNVFAYLSEIESLTSLASPKKAKNLTFSFSPPVDP